MAVSSYLALIHYPIVDRNGLEVTTSVTNLDIHDISRSVRTFGLKKYFIVTPIPAQHELVGRILGHWHREKIKDAHPKRTDALSLVLLMYNFLEVKNWITQKEGIEPEVVLTDAKPLDGAIGYDEYRREIELPERKRPVLLVFGTGWGVSSSFYSEVNRILRPVIGPQSALGYNHLSVRSAVGVILDRLYGEK